MGFPVSRESKFGDEAPVDELDLSVRVSNALSGAGIKTVGAFRDCDLEGLGIGAMRHRRAIAKALGAWDKEGAAAWAKRESIDRVAAARFALRALTDAERATLFLETGNCACRTLVRGAVKNPLAAVGALVGGLLGAVIETPSSPAKSAAGTDSMCLQCALGIHGCSVPGCICRSHSHGLGM